MRNRIGGFFRPTRDDVETASSTPEIRFFNSFVIQ